MAWKDGSFKAPIDKLKKKHLLAFLSQKAILAKNASYKYFSELKTH